MLSFFNLTVESREKKNDKIEPCYGGFSHRLDYEFHKDRRKVRSTVLLYAALVILIGATATAGGVVAYDFVKDNRSLYFPGCSDDAECVDKLSLSRAVPVSGISLAAVTHDQSVRYRIPRGVMIKVINSSAKRYSGFLAGDIIVAIDGNEILSVDDLYEYFDETTDSVFRVFRQNRYIDVDVLSE